MDRYFELLFEFKKEIDECRFFVEVVKNIFLFFINSCSVDKFVIEGEE